MSDNEKSIEERGLKDTKYLAKFFNRTERNIQQLATDKVLKAIRIKGVNYYELIPSIRAYISYLQDIVDRRKTTFEDLEKEKAEADVVYKRAKAKRAETELKQLNLSLLRASDVKLFVEHLSATIKSTLNGLPGRAAMDLLTSGKINKSDIADVTKIIRDLKDENLTAISEYKFDLDWYKERLAEDKNKVLLSEDDDFED